MPKNWITDIPIAHRGFHCIKSGVPENSLLSFQKCIEMDIAIELDIQMTQDGKAFVFHDENLKRVCSIDKNISDMNSCDLGNYFLNQTKESIPTLKDVLELVRGQVPLLIEIKAPNHNKNLVEAVYEDLKDYSGRFALQSFNPVTLMYCRKIFGKNVSLGILMAHRSRFKIAYFKGLVVQYMLLAPMIRPGFLSVYWEDLTLMSVKFWVCFYNIPVISWTIDSLGKFEEARKFSQNMIFETGDFLALIQKKTYI